MIRPSISRWPVFAIAACLAAALLAIPLSGMVEALGRNVPSSGLLPGHIQAILVGGLLTLTLPFWPGEVWEKRTLLAGWAIKLLVVLVAMLLYESFYDTLDAYSFYAGYGLTPDSVPVNPDYGFGLGDGTSNVTSLVQILKNGLGLSYHSIKVLFAYGGFAGCVIAYRAGVILTGRRSFVWLAAMLLTPSMIFWTGILGKDPIVLLGIATYLYGAASYSRASRVKDVGWILLGLFVASMMRLWLFPILVAPLIYLFATQGPRRLRLPLAGLVAVLFVGGGIGLAIMMQVTSMADLMPALAKVSQQWAEGGSAQKLDVPFDSLGGLFAFLPLGMFTALFRPLPMEVPNAFGLLAGVENAVLLGFLPYVILRKGLAPFRDRRVLFLLLCLLCWSLFYALISFQNLGTASRFRVQALPFMLLAGWCALSYRRARKA